MPFRANTSARGSITSGRDPGLPELGGHQVLAVGRIPHRRDEHGPSPNLPSYVLTYPDVAATSLGQRVNHLVYGGSVSVDERHGVPHWYQGGRLMLSAALHDAPLDALRFRDASMPASRFTRLKASARPASRSSPAIRAPSA